MSDYVSKDEMWNVYYSRNGRKMHTIVVLERVKAKANFGKIRVNEDSLLQQDHKFDLA